jgi:hypothetical protein
MQCYGEYSIPKNLFICEVALAGDDKRDIRIICYDSIEVQNRDYCESKYFSENYFNLDAALLQDCLKSAGYVLDKEFCDSEYKIEE